MNIIQKDENGLFIEKNDVIFRCPYNSTYSVGEKVSTHVYIKKLLGVGQNRTCRTGEYIELWKRVEKE